MFQALVILLIVLILMMIICVAAVNKNVVRNRNHVVHLIWTAVITAACYTGFILVRPDYPALAYFAAGLYFLSTDWLVIYLMLFVSAYTRMKPPSLVPRRIIGLLGGVDSVSFVVNTFTHHMFELKTEFSKQLDISYWHVQLKGFHVLHRVFVYSIVLYSLCVLAYSLVKAPSIYKNKFSSILFQTLSVVGLNIFCSAMDAKFDYSVILYGSLAISICYLALYASPRKLLRKIHSTIVQDSVIGLFAYDNEGKCVGVNQVARELFGSQEDIYETAEKYLTSWREEQEDNGENVVCKDSVIEKEGRKIYLYVSFQKFLDEKGRNLGCCFQFENRTEMIIRFQEEQYRATHDELTGLLNRDAFEDVAGRILKDADEPYCIVCSNIRDFKLVNELYGTEAGDRLLTAQGEMIRRMGRENSASARIYADKFCTLMPRKNLNEQVFRDNMSALIEQNQVGAFKLHYDIGVYEIQDVKEPVWTMYDKAMLAIDAAQGNYEESVSYYKDEFLKNIMQEKEILSEFDDALKEKQFCMFLQPQIANDGNIVGAEALVRWIHPQKGMVSPGIFIPTLEKAGLIHKLDLYMWDCAAQKLDQWKKQGKTFSISVNISATDFSYLDVCEAFRELLDRYDFDIRKLKLEITESALMKNVKETMKAIDGLHALGYDIEIDDFGNGYSSLGMLKDINADILKIDMIFLQETQNVERSTTILKHIISMSKELGMPVITEGVETREQVDFLMDVGCDMFQGYYFAKPMNLELFEQQYCQATG